MFDGMYTALVTPFIEKGGDLVIDWDSYTNLIEWQLSAGVDGLVLYGTTGESPTLTHNEKIELTIRAKEIVKGKVPLIVGAGTNSTATTLEFIQEIKEIGVDGVLLVAPYYNKPSQEGLYQHFSLAAHQGKLPVVVYNVPSRTSVEISIETLTRLADVANIVAVKQATDSVQNLTELSLATSNKWSILAGDDPIVAYVMMLGGKGVISASASVIPKEMCEIVNAGKEGDFTRCIEAQKKVLAKIKVIFSETNPTPAKALLKMMGIIKSDVVRLPLVNVQDSTKEKLKAVFNL